METLHTILALPIKGLHYYLQTMNNFIEAKPVLAFFTVFAILVAMIYLTVKSFKKQKTDRKIYDINARLKDSPLYIDLIVFILSRVLLSPLLLVQGILYLICGLLRLAKRGVQAYYKLRVACVKANKRS